MTYFGTSGKLQAARGKGGELLDHLLEAARAMEAVPGCLCYIVGTSEETPDAVYVHEVWRTAEEHQASLQLPAVRALIQKAMPIIAGMENQPDQIIHGGKARL